MPDQSSATAVGVDALGEAVGLDEEQLLTVIVECERQVAALQARQVAALSALADARAGTLLEGFAEDEVALALTISPNAARQRVSDAQTLSHQLPDTLSALAAGALDYYRARCIVEAVSGLDDDVAVAVQARVLPGAAERTATQLRAALRRAVLAVDPVGAAARHAMAAADRRVDFHPDANGMAYLGVAAPADDTLAVYTAIDGLARAARRVSGETRTLPQLRADTLADIARHPRGRWLARTCVAAPTAPGAPAGHRRRGHLAGRHRGTRVGGWLATVLSPPPWPAASPPTPPGGGSSPIR